MLRRSVGHRNLCSSTVDTEAVEPDAPETTAATTPRIAIAGAGISGLTLAAILSRELLGSGTSVWIDVFERGSRDADQGYGLDLDEHGQEALARAGAYDRYWSISQPKSDTAVGYSISGDRLGRLCRPRILQRLVPKWFGARPETNRGGLREVLLESLARQDNCAVHFNTAVRGIRRIPTGDSKLRAQKVELLGANDIVLGTAPYDLVIDSMGLHSTLRGYRVDDPQGKHYSGQMVIHGSFDDPDASFSPDLRERVGTHGTVFALGRGYTLFMQRYGAGAADPRACLFYICDVPEGEDRIFAEMGFAKPTSRADGIIGDDERKSKVQEWIKRDMGAHFDAVWSSAIDRLDRVTVRGDYTHGTETALREDDAAKALPLVCIGDSLRNCGLGGGGILAMQDAIEVADLLVRPRAFDGRGGADLTPLRAAEPTMLARKHAHMASKRKWRQRDDMKRPA